MDKYTALLIQFIKFGIVGVSNTAGSLAAYYTLVYVGLHYLAANVVGFILGVLNSYFWNSRYVFQKNSGSRLKIMLRMYAGYGLTFVLGMAIMFLQVERLGISEYIAPVVNIAITVAINFAINKLWVFRE